MRHAAARSSRTRIGSSNSSARAAWPRCIPPSTRLGRKFAVKVLRAGTGQQSQERFRREARAIAEIDSEFVVGVIDCGEAGDGTPYLVMELLRGEDLRSLLDREGALPIPRAVNLVWEASLGVSAVHARALVHRDLKPENLYVSKRATGEDWCRVLDFGIAKSDASNSTVEGALIGTVRYMAPEQLQNAASAGPSVDVYALGAVLYECIAGVPPYQAGAMPELMFKILNEPVPRLDRDRAWVPKGLADAVERALAKSPAQRYSDIGRFASAVQPYSRSAEVEALDARAPTVDLERNDLKSLVKPSSRNGYVAVAVYGSVGLIIGATFAFPFSAPRARSPLPVPVAVPVPPRAAVATAKADVPASLPLPLPSASASARSFAPAKAPLSAPARRPKVSSQVRFDSENPYSF